MQDICHYSSVVDHSNRDATGLTPVGMKLIPDFFFGSMPDVSLTEKYIILNICILNLIPKGLSDIPNGKCNGCIHFESRYFYCAFQ